MPETGMSFTGERAKLKADFVADRGYWSGFWDYLLALDPDYFKSYLDYSALPWRDGVLEPKVKEFVYCAIDVATTHLYELGLRIHFKNALKHGATRQELMAVIKVVSGLGVHTATVALPLLKDALARAGRGGEVVASNADRATLKARFVETLGYWGPEWDDFLALAPDWFAVHLNMAAVALQPSVLEPKVVEFMHIAACASVTHLHEPALKTHLDRALAHGASAAEIVEVLELTSVLGMHSCTLGLPALVDELMQAGQAVGPEG